MNGRRRAQTRVRPAVDQHLMAVAIAGLVRDLQRLYARRGAEKPRGPGKGRRLRVRRLAGFPRFPGGALDGAKRKAI
jgi:hypothetical protein